MVATHRESYSVYPFLLGSNVTDYATVGDLIILGDLITVYKNQASVNKYTQ